LRPTTSRPTSGRCVSFLAIVLDAFSRQVIGWPPGRFRGIG
jgi:transposase InsO family protein